MGQVNSFIEDHIESEFERVKMSEKRSYITVEEAKGLKSFEDMPITFSKLAVLFMLDFDKNGKITLDDIKKFANWCAAVTSHLESKATIPSSLFESEVQAQCALSMWKQVVSTPSGVRAFSDWFVRIFSAGYTVKKKSTNTNKNNNNSNMKIIQSKSEQNHSGHLKTNEKELDASQNTQSFHSEGSTGKKKPILFVMTDIISTVHEVLSINELYGINCQTFIHVMQKVGEEMDLQSLEDENLDDVIPIQVMHLFAENFITGFLNMMNEVGFEPEKYASSCGDLINDDSKQTQADTSLNSSHKASDTSSQMGPLKFSMVSAQTIKSKLMTKSVNNEDEVETAESDEEIDEGSEESEESETDHDDDSTASLGSAIVPPLISKPQIPPLSLSSRTTTTTTPSSINTSMISVGMTAKTVNVPPLLPSSGTLSSQISVTSKPPTLNLGQLQHK